MVCGLALVFSIAAPAQAAALTSAQVQAIIGLLQSFGADQSVINNVSVVLGGTSSGSQTCSTFADLAYGNFDTGPGGRVSQLQTWFGISSSTFGFGTYGPRTLALWNSRCGGGTTNNVNFSASPTYGIAPLAVSFTITAEAGEYSVEFGDGQSTAVTMPAVQCFRAPCNTQTTVSHSYVSAGTYTAKLMYQPPYYCPPGAYCAMMMPAPKQVGAVTISVTDRVTTGSPSISLTSPAAGTRVAQGQQLVLSWNAQNMPSNSSVGFWLMKTGGGSAGAIALSQPASGSYTWTVPGSQCDANNVCKYVADDPGVWYTEPGSYTIVPKIYSPKDACFGYCVYTPITYPAIGAAVPITITASGSSGGVPSINGLDAPTSLSVGQTGTWTVRATAPSGTQLRYSVVWGDEGWGATTGSAQAAQSNVQTSATFSHTYQNAGTYSPTFTVSNNYGSVQTSASVVVTSGTTVTPTFSAWPTSGTAPLTTYLTMSGVSSPSSYSVNFGDGSNGNNWQADTEAASTYFIARTYASAGTYYAKLMYQPPFVCNAPAGAVCNQVMPALQTVGTATITVTGGASNTTFSANQTSGWAPLGVRFTATGLDSSASYYVDFGDSTSETGSCSITSTSVCQLGTMYFNHTYTTNGTYTASLVKKGGICTVGSSTLFCGNPDQVVGTVTITVMTGWL